MTSIKKNMDNLHDLLQRNERLYAGRIAIRCEGTVRTHGELADRARRLGSALQQRGVRHGDRVAILARNGIEMVESLCACEWYGYVAVPLNHRLAAKELADIVRDCSPAALIAELEFDVTAQLLRGVLRSPALMAIVGSPDHELDYESLVSSGNCVPPSIKPGGQDTAYIIYTSGSTGRPKGVMLGHAGMVESGRLLSAPAGVRPDSLMLVVMPLFHVGAIAQRLGHVVNGSSILLHRKFDAATVVADIEKHRITEVHLAPMMLRSVLDCADRTDADLSSLETVKYASSPIPDDTLDRAIGRFGPHLLQFYAMTEAGGIATVLHKYVHAAAARGESPRYLRSAGQAHWGCAIETRRADGSLCDVDESGEVWLQTPSVMQGYWSNDALTREARVGPWLRTGDVGRLDADNFLFIVDRMKDMIISGGENIYSSEVERALESHPAVLEAAVIGVPDEKWGESVKAFVVYRPGAEGPSADDLIEYCRDRIGSYKKPRTIEFLERLPRLPHVEKIDKSALRLPYWVGKTRQV